MGVHSHDEVEGCVKGGIGPDILGCRPPAIGGVAGPVPKLGNLAAINVDCKQAAPRPKYRAWEDQHDAAGEPLEPSTAAFHMQDMLYVAHLTYPPQQANVKMSIWQVVSTQGSSGCLQAMLFGAQSTA